MKRQAPIAIVAEFQAQYGATSGNDLLSLVTAVREGITFKSFERLLQTKLFTTSFWARVLHTSERTLLRYQKAGHTFDAVQSERILQVVLLYAYGVEVFESEEEFQHWLSTQSLALGGRVPQNLLDSSFGIELIRDELGRIEHGVLA